jgi:hypothetical protein
MTQKAIIVPVSLALHTKFKHRCAQDGRSMSQVVRALMEMHVEGLTTPDPTALAKAEPFPWRAERQRKREAELDVYDEIDAMAKELLG